MASRTLPLTEIPTLSALYRTGKLSVSTSGTEASPHSRYNSLLSLIRYDITKLSVSAVVNAANERLLGGGGVDGAIHRAAGPRLLEECATLNGCRTGSAKITKGYRLPAEHVIHAVGPIYSLANMRAPGGAAQLLAGCYKKSLDLASENECKSIAFSALSTGIYGYPSDEAAETVLKTVRNWLDEKGPDAGDLERIVFCCFEMKDVRAYEELLPKYFPPAEEDAAENKEDISEAIEEREAQNLKKSMPSPPKTEPLAPGEPAAKRQKVPSNDGDASAEDDDRHDESGLDEPSHTSRMLSSAEILHQSQATSQASIIGSDDNWEVVDKPSSSQETSQVLHGNDAEDEGESQDFQLVDKKTGVPVEVTVPGPRKGLYESFPKSTLQKDW